MIQFYSYINDYHVYSYRFQDVAMALPCVPQVHRNLHWDIETSEAQWPVPFAIQGIVYLEATETRGGHWDDFAETAYLKKVQKMKMVM